MDFSLEQLFEQWTHVFEELGTIPSYKDQVKSTSYAPNSRFEIENFDFTHFPSGGSLSSGKDSLEGLNYYEYGFNEDGLPCFCAFAHLYNQIFWEGFYTYNERLVRYVEFCLNTGVPSAFLQLEFLKGRKVAYKQLRIAAGASWKTLLNLSKEKAIDKIRSDESSIISNITFYHYDATGKIIKETNIGMAPGMGEFNSHGEYSYDKDQNLDSIRTYNGNGRNWLSYCRMPENLLPDELVEDLANALASLIVDTLTNKEQKDALALIELSYHYADSYFPIILPHYAGEIESNIENNASPFFSGFDRAIYLDIKTVEKLYAQLEQVMSESDNMDLGRKMLQKAAGILTNTKLLGRLDTVSDFACYAIDWSIEGHGNEDFERILRECEVNEDILISWTQKGILPI